ncbi:MAG: right-handed parallel beta-helix repeat-containing protein, partial [Clostridia bacterium]|nr:right-handed parallel beta-helix repeat-containing protein [Clostridia bacterium]
MRRWIGMLSAVCLMVTLLLSGGVIPVSAQTEEPLSPELEAAASTPVTEYTFDAAATNYTTTQIGDGERYLLNKEGYYIISFDYYIVTRTSDKPAAARNQNLGIYDEGTFYKTYPVDAEGNKTGYGSGISLMEGVGITHHEQRWYSPGTGSTSRFRLWASADKATLKVYIWNFSIKYESTGEQLAVKSVDHCCSDYVSTGKMLADYQWYLKSLQPDNQNATVLHLRGSELTEEMVEYIDPNTGNPARHSRTLLSANSLRATAGTTWKLQFDYFLVDESPIFLYDYNLTGQPLYDDTTGSRLLQQGRHTYTCTITNEKNVLPAFFYYYDPNYRAPSDLYIWNFTLTSADGKTVKSFTPDRGYLFDNDLVTVHEDVSPNDLIGGFAEQNAVYELDFTGVASVEAGGGQNPTVTITPFKEFSPDYIYELSFDYFLPSAETRSYIYMGDQYYLNEIGGKTFINEAEGEEHTYEFQQGRHHFSATIKQFQTTAAGMLAALNVCMYQSAAEDYTDYTLSKMYIWNLKFTPVANADGSAITWNENYYHGKYWTAYSTGTAVTEKKVAADLLTQKDEVKMIGAQYREDYSVRFVSVVECDGVVRGLGAAANYTDGKIVIKGVEYPITGAGTLFARDVKIKDAGATEDVLRLNSGNANVRDIPADKLLSSEMLKAYAPGTKGIIFTGVIKNVPRSNWDETLSARAYVTYLDEFNEEQVWYGNVVSRSVMQVKSVIPYNEQNSRYDSQANAMRNEIVNAPNETYSSDASTTVYYVSPNGNDNNDGKSPEKAWKTLNKVNALSDGTSYKKQVVLFERGGLWRGSIITRAYTTYGAYGTGAKPRFYGSLMNYANVEWKKSEQYPNVWEVDTSVNDAFVHLDTQEEWGNDIGAVFFTDYRYNNRGQVVGDDVVYWGEKMFYDYDADNPTRPEMLKDFQFYHDQLNHKLYMYLELEEGETPADLSDCIEFAPRYRVVVRNEDYTSNYITIENLCIKYTGSHGIGFGASSNLTIRNCEIGWIGGSMHSGKTRFGNGIEIYGNSHDDLVENNWIYQCYDAGFTNQGGTQYNITARNNLVEYCLYNIEIWEGSDDLNADGSVKKDNRMYDCTYENNLLRFAGYNFERDNRMGSGLTCSSHFNFYYHERDMQNVVVKNNVLDTAYCALVMVAYPNQDGKGPIITGNTYVQSYDRYSSLAFLWCLENEDPYNGGVPETYYKADNQTQIEASAKLLDPNYVAAYYDGKVSYAQGYV